jgi:phage antirepressor YoqD-like protein
MNEIQVFNYNGSGIAFSTDKCVMVSATAMAKPFGKSPTDWLKTRSAKQFVKELGELKNINSVDLVKVTYGDNGGTWMHEDVALEFARWLAPKFAIWCNDRIKELLTYSKTNMPAIPQTFAEALQLAADQAKQIEQQQALLLAQGEAIAEKDKAISELHEKTSYLDKILQSKETITTTQIAQDYGMSAKKFNVELRNMKIQRKVGGQWILYSPYNTMGYVHSETFIPESSTTRKVVTLSKWTQKGRLFLYEEMKKRDILPLIERR